MCPTPDFGRLHPEWVPGLTAALQEEVCRRLAQLGEQYECRWCPEGCKLEADLIKSWAQLYADEGGGPAD